MEPTTTPRPQARLATFLLLAILTFLPSLLFGTHIRGGYLTGETISEDGLTYRFTVILYRDTEGVPAQPGLFQFRDMDGKEVAEGVVIDPTPIGFIDESTEIIMYQVDHIFPAPGRYKVSYYEQNRNNGVRNIFASESTAFFIASEFLVQEGLQNRASSMGPIGRSTFDIRYPSHFKATIGIPNTFNYLFEEPDGDALAYRLTVCKQGVDENGQTMEVVRYRYPNDPEFGGIRHDGSSPVMFSLNPISGDLIWDSPGQLGEYNIAFYVDEWRDGVLISSINCDIQIMVSDYPAWEWGGTLQLETIEGRLFMDLGGKNIPVPYTMIALEADDTTFLAITDNLGRYTVNVPKRPRNERSLGGRNVLIDKSLNELFSLQSQWWWTPLDQSHTYVNDLYLLPKQDFAKTLTLGGFPMARCGFTERIDFSVQAISKGETSLEVIFVPDPKTKPVGAGSAGGVESGGRISWGFSGVQPGERLPFSVDLQMPGCEFMGEGLEPYIITHITSSDGQEASSDTLRLWKTLTGDLGLNSRYSVAVETERAPYVFQGNVLEYTVHFQNMGKDTVNEVRVLDRLGANLDLSTFKLIGASHEVKATPFKHSELIFEFGDIMLPGRASNEAESKGYVTFQVAPREGLGHMELIRNRALIYFDYNPPVTSNYTEDYFAHYLPLYAPLLYGRYQDGQARLQVDNREPLPTTLLVERSQSEGFESIDTVFTLSGETDVFWDSGITEGPIYYYRARVEGEQGHYSDHSRPLVLDTQKKWAVPATVAPILSARMEGRDMAGLNWEVDPVDITGFRLERSLSSSFNPVTPYQLAAGTEAYEDKGLPMADSVYYRIKALTPYGESYYSNVASVSPLVTGLSGDVVPERQLLVYPVPAKRELYVEVEGHGAVGASLFGQTGVEVYRGSWQGDRAHRIGLEGIPPGLYLLRVATGGRFFTRKVVVE